MEKDFILTSAEFSKLVGISAESLRSRRRRGLYEGMYIRKSISYLWQKPAPDHRSVAAFLGQTARDESRLSAKASNANIQSTKSKNLGPGPRKRNKNSRKHYQELISGKQGTKTNYPNKAFELANEYKIVLKAQRKISAAAAEEITPELIKLAEEKHRQNILTKMKEPFIPEAHKENVEHWHAHKRQLQRDEILEYEEDSSKWHDPLNPDNNRQPTIKKKTYY